MADAHANFATSLVATAPSPATSGTSLTVTAGEGSRFPAVPFNAVVHPENTIPTPANAEIVRVTSRSSDTLTITRAQEGSTARSITAGDRVYNAPTVKVFTDLETAQDWSKSLMVTTGPHRTVGTWSLGSNGSAHGYLYRNNATAADGDYMEWDVGMAAGTWTLKFLMLQWNSAGILTASIDGVDVGTTDLYASAATWNYEVTMSGIVVATTGKKALRVRVNGKNASSAAYNMHFQNEIGLLRTA